MISNLQTNISLSVAADSPNLLSGRSFKTRGYLFIFHLCQEHDFTILFTALNDFRNMTYLQKQESINVDFPQLRAEDLSHQINVMCAKN